jgi:hypothetical protein
MNKYMVWILGFASARRAERLPVIVAAVSLLCGATTTTAADFEVPPDQSPTALLPPEFVVGKNFSIVDPVHDDGLMHRYVIDSRFGRFEAYGRSSLEIRVHEVAALTELANTSDIKLVANGVEQGAENQIHTAIGVATNPVGTVTGIPKGIAHLFSGFGAEGEEALAQGRRLVKVSGDSGSSQEADKAADAAKEFAAQYFGLTHAEMRWYKKLGVDPYTDNVVLRNAIRKNAKVEATASFGMRFAGLPQIPGIGLMERATDAIYNENPAAVRARARKMLTGYGLSPTEIETWQNSKVLSPTRQVLLLAAADALTGVEGRGELFRHALGLTSDAEAQVYLQSVGLLLQAHRVQPLTAVLAGVRLPAARRADGRVVVCGAFESVYWTEDVAIGEAQVRQSLPAGVSTPQLWLTGSVSERTRSELQQRGWELHEFISGPLAKTAPE